MAVTPVSLKVGSYAEREVLSVEYEFDQAVDTNGQITGLPRGGKITFKVKALNDGNPEMMVWMVARSLPQDGTVIFNETKTGKKMKDIAFKTAYCVDYHSDWEDKVGDVETFTITCKEITVGNAVYTNPWK